eukprot:5074554-Amphidinium_carterae.1
MPLFGLLLALVGGASWLRMSWIPTALSLCIPGAIGFTLLFPLFIGLFIPVLVFFPLVGVGLRGVADEG